MNADRAQIKRARLGACASMVYTGLKNAASSSASFSWQIAAGTWPLRFIQSNSMRSCTPCGSGRMNRRGASLIMALQGFANRCTRVGLGASILRTTKKKSCLDRASFCNVKGSTCLQRLPGTWIPLRNSPLIECEFDEGPVQAEQFD